jgi:hypothetical protein
MRRRIEVECPAELGPVKSVASSCLRLHSCVSGSSGCPLQRLHSAPRASLPRWRDIARTVLWQVQPGHTSHLGASRRAAVRCLLRAWPLECVPSFQWSLRNRLSLSQTTLRLRDKGPVAVARCALSGKHSARRGPPRHIYYSLCFYGTWPTPACPSIDAVYGAARRPRQIARPPPGWLHGLFHRRQPKDSVRPLTRRSRQRPPL